MFAIQVPSVFLINDKHRKYMKVQIYKWFKVNCIFIISFFQVYISCVYISVYILQSYLFLITFVILQNGKCQGNLVKNWLI